MRARVLDVLLEPLGGAGGIRADAGEVGTAGASLPADLMTLCAAETGVDRLAFLDGRSSGGGRIAAGTGRAGFVGRGRLRTPDKYRQSADGCQTGQPAYMTA